MLKKSLPFILAGGVLAIGGLTTVAHADTQTQTIKNSEQVQQLAVDAPAKIVLKTGNEFKVQSKFPGHQKTKITNQDGQIKISHPHQKHQWGIKISFNDPKSVITVTVPKNVKLTDLKINSQAADIQLDSPIQKLNIASHSGDVKIKNTNPQDLKINSESGDVNLNNSKFKTINVDSESGDIKAHDLTADDLTLNSESGDVKIINQKVNNYDQVTINSDSGDVTIKNAKINQSNIDTASGELNKTNTKIKHADNSTDY